MIPYVCLYADTLEVHHFQEFREDEVLPIDLPYKNLIWRRVVEVHPPYDTRTEQERGTSREITETECIYTHLIIPRPPVVPETPEELQSRTMRVIQTACFAGDRLPLSMLVYELTNEIRVLKGEEPLNMDDFKRRLQYHAR
jgi:hypothetical protein